MLIGYARVSLRLKQDVTPQVDALTAAGCERVFSDHNHRWKDDRAGLQQALSHLRAGDTLVITRLDRAVSGMRQAVQLLDQLRAAGSHLVSLAEGIDTRTPLGEAMLTIASAFSQLEVQANQERTRDRLEYLKKKGVKMGRKPSLSDEDVRRAEAMLKGDPDLTVAEVAEVFGVARQTLTSSRKRVREAQALAQAARDSISK